MASKFETEIRILPRDIDVNGHVHHTVYLDFLLAARYDQMARCYGMSMEEFLERGYTWFVRQYEIEYKAGLELGDTAVVRTWVEEVGRMSVDVGFEIESKATGRLAAKGIARYVMMGVETGRPVRITQDIIDKYSV